MVTIEIRTSGIDGLVELVRSDSNRGDRRRVVPAATLPRSTANPSSPKQGVVDLYAWLDGDEGWLRASAPASVELIVDTAPVLAALPWKELIHESFARAPSAIRSVRLRPLSPFGDSREGRAIDGGEGGGTAAFDDIKPGLPLRGDSKE